MSNVPLTELTDRARAIFQLVVEGYIADGQPVGSKALANDGRVELSPASIRSVLADLEQLGLLAAPHTSAGRMPTETGLRLFVDGMMQVAEPSREERAEIEKRLRNPGPIERALEATSTLLSDISGAAGMVMVPQREVRLQTLLRVENMYFGDGEIDRAQRHDRDIDTPHIDAHGGGVSRIEGHQGHGTAQRVGCQHGQAAADGDDHTIAK